jgi:hypothetical protein
VPEKATVICDSAANPDPVMDTDVRFPAADGLSEITGVTVNVLPAEFASLSTATTKCLPTGDAGDMIIALNAPLESVATLMGLVTIVFPSKLIVSCEFCAKPDPLTVTTVFVPLDPEGLNRNIGAVTLNPMISDLVESLALSQ